MSETINIPDEEFIPSFCNRFGISRSNGEILIEFFFKNPGPPDKDTESKLIKRIAMTREGAEKFCDTLRMSVTNPDMPPGKGTARL